MPELTERFADAWERSRRHLALALVPAATGLLAVDHVTSFRETEVTLRTTLPAGVLDIWSFVGSPGPGVSGVAGAGAGGSVVTGLLALVVLTVVRAALAAGYFGSVADLLTTGEYDFERNAGRYFLRFLYYEVAVAVVGLVVGAVTTAGVVAGSGPTVAASGVALLLALVAFLVLGYLFFATPYLMVLRDTALLPAARASYSLAVEGGPYFSYAAGFALVVLAASPFVSVLVTSLSALGLLLGLAGGAVAGLVGNVATMRFLADIDPKSPSVDPGGGSTAATRSGPSP